MAINPKIIFAPFQTRSGNASGVIITSASSFQTLIDSNSTTLERHSAGWQVAGSVASVYPPTSLAINPSAAVVTTSKIIVDVRDGRGVNPGDCFSVAGNVVAIVAAVGTAVGATVFGMPIMVPATLLSIGLSIIGYGLDKWYQHSHQSDQYLKDGREYSIYDPLIINLDGKGLNVASFKNTDGVMLDIDGDGIANKSSWVAAGNGVLFFDDNENNQFDDATELFSDSRLLSDGKVAENGFEAAKHYDSDGNLIIDQNDADFHKFKVLVVDENGEEHILSLSDLGIVSLNLNYEHTNQYLGDGNSITQIATYTKADGTTGQIGDVNFSYDTVDSKYLNNIDLTDELLQLPNLTGVGFLRNLNQAAAISEDLQNKLSTYANLQTKQEQLDYLFNLAQAWAKTSPYYNEDALQLQPVSMFMAVAGSDNRYTPSQFSSLQSSIAVFNPEEQISKEDREKFDEIRIKYAILKEFLGVKSDTVYLTSADEIKAVIASVEEDFNNLINDMYQGLLLQTRLKPYWEAMNLIIDENAMSVHWDFSATEALFRSKWDEDSLNATIDLGEFLQSFQWLDGSTLICEWLAIAQDQGVADEYLALLGEGGFLLDYQKLDAAGTLKGSAKNDILQGSDADDQLEGGDGEDVINAEDGNDRIYGGNGSDTITGGRGNDAIYDGNGDDRVDAGDGNDYIEGGQGSDTYIFKGDFGKDSIYNYYSGAEDVDVIDIQGRNRDEFSLTRYGENLYITDKSNPENQIKVEGFFYNDADSAVEQIKFADPARRARKARHRARMGLR